MDWQQAKDHTIRYWTELRDSIDGKDNVELLRDINAVNKLCDKAKTEAHGDWGRCHFCIAYDQFGGCTGVSLKMSECVVDGDRETLKALVDGFIENLEALKVPLEDSTH